MNSIESVEVGINRKKKGSKKSNPHYEIPRENRLYMEITFKIFVLFRVLCDLKCRYEDITDKEGGRTEII